VKDGAAGEVSFREYVQTLALSPCATVRLHTHHRPSI
jgi:hypothetical protein